MKRQPMFVAVLFCLLNVSAAIPTAFGGDEDYTLGADSMRQEGVPQGKVTKAVWRSKVFPETLREYEVHVPSTSFEYFDCTGTRSYNNLRCEPGSAPGST